MARGRARWKNSIDPKPHLTSFMGLLEHKYPFFTGFLRYHGQGSELQEHEILENIEIMHTYREKIYSNSYDILKLNNVDAFARETREDCTYLKSAIIESGCMHGHALFPVRDNGKLIGSSLGWGFAYPMPRILPSERISGISIAIPNIKNYYHLLLDHLVPAVCCVIRNPQIFNRRVNFISNKKIAAIDFFVEILKEIGFDARSIVIWKSQSVLCERILYAKAYARSVEHTYGFASEMRIMRHYIDKKIHHIKTPDRVYIPRTQTRIRNILNQKEVERNLLDKGVVSYPFSWGNFLEQVAIFRRSELIVSAHGAALTNLMFGDEGKVVEIHAYNARKTTYLHIASQHSWKYTPIIGGKEQKNQNFNIDIENLMDGLDGRADEVTDIRRISV